MLIYKSFFRKKTTKIYLLIYSLILLVVGLLLSTKIILNNKQKELYNGSYIFIKTNDIEELSKINNIEKIYEGIPIKLDDYFEAVLISDEKYKIKDDYVMIPEINKNKYKINDKVNITIDDKKVELFVGGYINYNGSATILYSSNNIIKKYSNSDNMGYLIILKDWNKYPQTLNEFKKINGDSIVSINNNESMQTFIKIINIMLLILLILFVIVLAITCVNIIEDETKKNNIYYKVGYSKFKLKIYNLNKILLLIIFSSIIASFITLLLNLIYKIII